MENKVLVQVCMPELGINHDVFIPVNEVIWKIKKMLLKCISDISNLDIDFDKRFVLINKDSGSIYTNNDIVINTDIRNGTELVLLSDFRK